MYIRSRAAAAISDLLIGVLSLVAEWFLLGRYGWAALRFFPTWVLFLSAVYFLTAALLITLRSRRDPNRKPCPMLEGMILIGFLTIAGTAVTSSVEGFALPKLDLWLIWLLCAGLPILILADWLLFAKKGYWQVAYPFYWLALPLTYAFTMILTAEYLPEFTTWLYPLELLNYRVFGFWDMIGWLTPICMLILIAGYVLYLLDFAFSGKLAKYIVLPHIQTILVDENGKPIPPELLAPETSSSPSASHTTAATSSRSNSAAAFRTAESSSPASESSTPPVDDSPEPASASTAADTSSSSTPHSAPRIINQNSTLKSSPSAKSKSHKNSKSHSRRKKHKHRR